MSMNYSKRQRTYQDYYYNASVNEIGVRAAMLMMSQRDLCTCETQPTGNQSTLETVGI